MDLGIKGKTALVLSAGGGLGRAIAVAIAKEGASVAVTDIDENHLEATAAEIKKTGANVFTHPVDLADLPGLDDLVARITQKFGGVDILVNISGGPPPTPAVSVSTEFWIKYFHRWFFSFDDPRHRSGDTRYACKTLGTRHYQCFFWSRSAHSESVHLEYPSFRSGGFGQRRSPEK